MCAGSTFKASAGDRGHSSDQKRVTVSLSCSFWTSPASSADTITACWLLSRWNNKRFHATLESQSEEEEPVSNSICDIRGVRDVPEPSGKFYPLIKQKLKKTRVDWEWMFRLFKPKTHSGRTLPTQWPVRMCGKRDDASETRPVLDHVCAQTHTQQRERLVQTDPLAPNPLQCRIAVTWPIC